MTEINTSCEAVESMVACVHKLACKGAPMPDCIENGDGDLCIEWASDSKRVHLWVDEDTCDLQLMCSEFTDDGIDMCSDMFEACERDEALALTCVRLRTHGFWED